MEPDEQHEPQYEHDEGMDITEFEEQNYDWLIEKFMRAKAIVDSWADFVYAEYCNNRPEPPDNEDR